MLLLVLVELVELVLLVLLVLVLLVELVVLLVVDELRIVLEQLIQLSVQGRHGDFSVRREFAHFPDIGLFFLSTKSLQHLQLTRYLAPVS